MRIIIKNADFSQVSIGKVVKDLSFAFDSSNGAGGGTGHGDMDVINAFFPNFNSGSPTSATYYSGSSGGTVTDAGTTVNRIVSDFIEVSEGMTITAERMPSGGSSSPIMIAFDANKAIISSACMWASGTPPYIDTKVLPAGVKYIKFQTGASSTAIGSFEDGYPKCSGSMPQ